MPLKPLYPFPPFFPSFCLSLWFSLSFHSLATTAASGRGCQAALMPQEEEGWSLPSKLPMDTKGCQRWAGAAGRNKRERGGMAPREPEGHPLAAEIPKSFEVLGLDFFSHQYPWERRCTAHPRPHASNVAWHTLNLLFSLTRP